MRAARKATILAALLALGFLAPARAQNEPKADTPEPPPPPPPVETVEPAWELPKETLDILRLRSEVYRDYAVRFICAETVRVAHYDASAEATSEKTQYFDYMLLREGADLKEYREIVKKRQKNKDNSDAAADGKKVDDEEQRFPPAFAWVFLFDSFYQPYFMFRNLGDRFEGFDWVHEIQFRGALPFTDGRDIREWEGTVLVDAVTHTPIEIRAEPTAQRERIRALFDRWSQGFNLVGVRLAPRPFGYRCRVVFGLRRDSLTFPTELRYDTFRATGPKQFVPWMASVRVYNDYKFFKTETTETPGGAVPQ